MIWRFIDSDSNTGSFNMDFDVQLAKEFDSNEAILRVYRWSPYCISFGANQNISEIDIQKASSENIDVVKRPTGGRAILHSEELTYSIIYPIDQNTSSHVLYSEINLALKAGLTHYNSVLSQIQLENNQPNFKDFYKEDKSSICFAVSAKSEINFNGKKLVGSAQRKFGNVILQHGSILCGDYHLRIADFLNLPENKKESIKQEISSTTVDLKTILNKEIDYSVLINSIKIGFADHFKINFVQTKETVLVN